MTGSFRSFVVAIASGCAVILGALSATQARINGELGSRLGDGITAAIISNTVGLSILTVAMIIWPPGRRGLGRLVSEVRARSIPWWQLLGGVAGAFYALSQTITAAALGIALFTIAMVSSQTVGGLIIDHFGLGPGGRRAVTGRRSVGAFLSILAVSIAMAGQSTAGVPLWLMWMPLLAGVGQGWQQAVNGRVKGFARSALTSTFLNYLTGTIALLVIFAVRLMVADWSVSLPTDPVLYLGGAVGCLFVAGSVLLVRMTGVFVLGLSVVAGQLLCSIVLDLLLPTTDEPMAITTLLGTALALIAVIVASSRSRVPRDAGAR